jgi:hypothetical protein
VIAAQLAAAVAQMNPEELALHRAAADRARDAMRAPLYAALGGFLGGVEDWAEVAVQRNRDDPAMQEHERFTRQILEEEASWELHGFIPDS